MWTNRQIWNGAPKDLDEEDSIGSYPRFAYRVVTQITQTTEPDTLVTPLARVQGAPAQINRGSRSTSGFFSAVEFATYPAGANQRKRKK